MHRSKAHLQSMLLLNNVAMVEDFYLNLVCSFVSTPSWIFSAVSVSHPLCSLGGYYCCSCMFKERMIFYCFSCMFKNRMVFSFFFICNGFSKETISLVNISLFSKKVLINYLVSLRWILFLILQTIFIGVLQDHFYISMGNKNIIYTCNCFLLSWKCLSFKLSK